MERQTAVLVRIPIGLKQAVEASARANRRSTVKEIQWLLERAVAPAQITDKALEQPQP